MTNAEKIKAIELRIALLKARGETANAPIVKKLERKKRALIANT